jgi:RND family efflux transporter MFP subunit
MSSASSIHRPRVRFVARVIVPGVILSATAALLVATSREAFESAPEVAVTPVAIVDSAHPRTVADSGLQAPGWIEPAPYAVEVRALREGVITDVRVLEGMAVEADALLATLERGAETIARSRADANARHAEAELARALAARDATVRAHALALGPARAVREAEAMLGEAEAMRVKLSADIAEAEAAEAEGRDELERKSELVASGSATEGEVRRLRLRAAALAARTNSLRSEHPAREARALRARGDLEAARTAQRELIEETRARDEAEAMLLAAIAARDAAAVARDEAQLALDRSEIRAPRAGTILRRNAVPGARVGGDSEALFLLYDPAALQVRCDVPLKDAGRLATGLAAEIRVDALPDRVFRGTVTRIVPLGDIQKNTVQCKVSVDSPDQALRPDMLARVRILTTAADSRVEAVAIPLETLRARDGDRGTVLLAVPEGRLARASTRVVTLGSERNQGWIEVLDGLAGGDRVVTDAGARDGMLLSPRERAKEEAP